MSQEHTDNEPYANVLLVAQRNLDKKHTDTALHIVRELATKHSLRCEELAWAYWKGGSYTDQEIQELINDAVDELMQDG